MILIISDADDLSTDNVIDYLHKFKAKYFRINFIDIIENNYDISFSLENGILKIGNQSINLNTINSLWMRKIGFIKKSEYFKKYENSFQALPSKEIYFQYLTRELHSFVYSILSLINKKAYWITNYSSLHLNKLKVLKVAKEYGLRIPETFITNKKNNILKSVNTKLISKSISESVFLTTGEHYYQMLTQSINQIDEIPNSFFPSLVQTNIDKDFELRIFYIDDKFYPTAIFSQNDKQTSVDFRNYNLNRPNRVVPYKLPNKLKNKLYTFTKAIQLNCGSIDMIKNKEGEYIFLEVNPTGQFGMVDIPCNYKLNKKIAKQLIKHS